LSESFGTDGEPGRESVSCRRPRPHTIRAENRNVSAFSHRARNSGCRLKYGIPVPMLADTPVSTVKMNPPRGRVP
jgi:hypothetical protein